MPDSERQCMTVPGSAIPHKAKQCKVVTHSTIRFIDCGEEEGDTVYVFKEATTTNLIIHLNV